MDKCCAPRCLTPVVVPSHDDWSPHLTSPPSSAIPSHLSLICSHSHAMLHCSSREVATRTVDTQSPTLLGTCVQPWRTTAADNQIHPSSLVRIDWFVHTAASSLLCQWIQSDYYLVIHATTSAMTWELNTSGNRMKCALPLLSLLLLPLFTFPHLGDHKFPRSHISSSAWTLTDHCSLPLLCSVIVK